VREVGGRQPGSVGAPFLGGCLCLCRSFIWLFVGCSRSSCCSHAATARRNSSCSFCATSCRSYGAGATPAADRQRSAATGGPQPRGASSFVARVLNHARDAAALAPTNRRAPDHPDAGPGAQYERLCRAVGWQRAPGVPRPTADLRAPPARARAPRLHLPLQPAASSPSARSATRGSRPRNRSFAHSDGLSAAGEATRPPRRTHSRIRSGGVKIEFVHPTGADLASVT
jgi:hypothetical protein